jgi:uncharacterized protein YndB with AHSA1/START domain
MAKYKNLQQEVEMEWAPEAAFQFESMTTLEASKEEVFKILEDGEQWTQWFENMTAVDWFTSDPKGVGTRRTVSFGQSSMEEHFLVWEEGRRMAFRFVSTTGNIFKALIEDYVLEDVPNQQGKCTFTYKVHAELSLFPSLCTCLILGPLNKLFGKAGT